MDPKVIDDIELARAPHVLFVVHWIGGVAFVTLVALPLARARDDPRQGWALFEAIERRFAAQVRVSIPLAGATGLWMTWRVDLWSRFGDRAFWWMDAMAILWTLFMLIVFVVGVVGTSSREMPRMQAARSKRTGLGMDRGRVKT
jgi:uncharacterized membrane protein